MKKRLSVIALILVLLVVTTSVSLAESVPASVMGSLDSVVRILSTYKDGIASGSGFVIKSNKEETLIATNYHVVEDNPLEISVLLDSEKEISAKVLAYSDQKDMAVLKLQNAVSSLTALPMKRGGAKQGDAVYAVGYPGASDFLSDKIAASSTDATITNGIVSAERQVTWSSYGSPVKILQINVDINHGNSGGPLFNSQGEVVGINTVGVTYNNAQGVNGAIEIGELLDFLQQNGYDIAPSKTTAKFPWIIVVAAVAALALALAAFLFFRKKKAKVGVKNEQTITQTLKQYIELHPKGVGQSIVGLLMPVAVQLRNLHNDGKLHLEVSPESILIKNGTAVLSDPKGQESNRYSSGFTAPEVYTNNGLSTASDIYSLAACIGYGYTGKVPENALKRSDNCLYTEEEITNIDLLAILNEGTSISPDQRQADVQEMIRKLTPLTVLRNNYSDNEQITSESLSAESEITINEFIDSEQNVKKGSRKKWPWLFVPVGLLVLFAAVYFVTYQNSVKRSEEQEFEEAKKLIWLPAITKMHDPFYISYLDAGILFEKQQYDSSKTAFRKLLGYRHSASLCNESMYRLAGQLADANQFDEAIEYYDALAKVNHKDSEELRKDTYYRKGVYYLYEQNKYDEAEKIFNELKNQGYTKAEDMINETIYFRAKDFIDKDNYLSAYKELKKISNYENVPQILTDLKEYIYLEGIEKYQKKDYSSAKQYFSVLDKYKLSEDYLFLLNVRNKSSFSSTDANKLLSMLSFEDASDIILKTQSGGEAYLRGKWKSTSGGQTFEMDEKGRIEYTLSAINYGYYYRIENGEILFYPKDNYTATKPCFRLTVIDRDTMRIYCYRNGKTYTMIRR